MASTNQYAEASLVISKASFEKIIKRGNLESMVEFLGRAGIVDPNNCPCDRNMLPKNDFLNTLHVRHRLTNRELYEKIPQDLFDSLRQTIEADLLGKIVQYEFGRQLLEHFLLSNALQADWI